ncbi:MAG: hypothetical protein ACE368_15605 [Paracoccaceae bacterium]
MPDGLDLQNGDIALGPTLPIRLNLRRAASRPRVAIIHYLVR